MQNLNESQDDIEELDAQLKAAKKAKRIANTLDAAVEFVEQTPLYYVSRLDHYLMRDSEGHWCFLRYSAICRTYHQFSDSNFRAAFTLAMGNAGRNFLDCTYSLAKTPPDKLNLLDITKWVQPEEGDYHWLFDLIIHSIGGGKADNIRHLEQLIVWKYLHPNCPTLPALVINGEGSLGKNLLVEILLKTLFDGMAIAAFATALLDKFNSPLKGKVCVLIDEAKASKIDHEKLKNMLGSSTLLINEKGVPQYEVPATAWYILSSNREGIYLDRSSADRRWSVFHVEAGKDLNHWLRPKLGNVSYDEAGTWVRANAPRILSNKQQIANWIHALIKKHEGLTQPLPFHGDDFDQLLDTQKPIEERIIEDVFTDPDFTHINRQTMHEGYRAMCEGERKAIPSRYFYARVRAWLKSHPDLCVNQEEVTRKHRTTRANHYFWAKNEVQTHQINENDSDYLDRTSAPPRWIGPTSR